MTSTSQLSTKHLLGIKQITREDILTIFKAAADFKEVINRPIKKVPSLRDVTVVNLFFENSTRTRISFELAERRLSAVLDIRHSSLENTQLAAKEWTTALQDRLGERVKGPIVPSISRVRNQYIRNVVIKLEKDDALITRTKQYILQLKDTFSQIKELKMVRVNIDVDPY